MKTIIDYIYNFCDFDPEHIKEFQELDFSRFDLKITDSKGYSPLMLIAKMNSQLHLASEKIDYIIRHSNLDQMNINNFKAINYILSFNKTGNLNLSASTIAYIIENTNLDFHTDANYNTLMYVCKLNKREELNLDSGVIDYIIDNSDLMLVNENKQNNLIYVLEACGALKQDLTIPVECYEKIINDTLKLKDNDFYPDTIEKCLRYLEYVWKYIENKEDFVQYVYDNYPYEFKSKEALVAYREKRLIGERVQGGVLSRTVSKI